MLVNWRRVELLWSAKGRDEWRARSDEEIDGTYRSANKDIPQHWLAARELAMDGVTLPKATWLTVQSVGEGDPTTLHLSGRREGVKAEDSEDLSKVMSRVR